MKKAIVCFAFSLLVGLSGCSQDHDKIGDAPRTVSATSATGWKEVSTSGIALQFPEGWRFLDLSKDTFDKGADQVFGNDPKFAAARSQASAVAKQGLIKLLAFETATIGSGFATNCNALVQNAPGQPLEQIADATVLQIAPMVAKGTQPKLEYVSLKSGRFALISSEIKPANPSVPDYVSLCYLGVKGGKLAAVTFTAPVKDKTHIQTIGTQIMDTFRFTD